MVQREALVKIVGSDAVDDTQAILEAYSRDMSFVNAIRPAFVVKPRAPEEVQGLVQLANETMTPLIPVSSGPPHSRGDTVPSIGGSVIVDLSGMNKVIFVDRPRRVAMVEPGVSFNELIPKVNKEGLRLNMPLLPRKNKSVIGSILEREPVLMPIYQWDASDPLACTGLFFGSGEEFRTGQAAGPGDVEDQWKVGGVQKAPYGPGTASWHRLIQGAQGTIGIVTWMSLRCELLPRLEEPFVLGSSDLYPLLDLASWLIRLRMVNECFILNNTNLAAIFSAGDPKEYLEIKNTLPLWTLFYTVAGYEYLPEKRVDSHIRDISDLTQKMGLTAARRAGAISANQILKTVQKPSEEPYWKLRQKGGWHDIMFLTVLEKIEDNVGIMASLAEKSGYSASNVGVYIQPVVQGTSYHCEFNLFYDPLNATELNRARKLNDAATSSLLSDGAFFSRPYGDEAEMIVNRDAATVDVQRKLKNIFDPNAVMNPGKVCF
jgi:hypothetical protein